MSGSRPTGAPFWGESIRIQDIYELGGYDPTTNGDGPLDSQTWDIIYGRGTGAPPVMASGDEVLVGSYGAHYLMDGDIADVSWVIVLGTGSSGTLQVNAGVNPDWDDNTAALTEDLGSNVVTGATTLVLPCSSVTVADILAAEVAGGSPQCWIQCTAGSVNLLQIKLRVWPPDGPLGGWAPGAESASEEIQPTLFGFEDVGLIGSPEVGADQPSAWSAGWAAMQAAYAPPSGALAATDLTGSPESQLGYGQAQVNLVSNFPDPSFTGTANYLREAVAVLVFPGWEYELAGNTLPGLTDGVDYIYPPDQVDMYRQDYTGTLSWVHDAAQIVVTVDLSGTSGFLSSTGLDYGAFAHSGTWTVTPATSETGPTIFGADGTYTMGIDATGNTAFQVVAGHSIQDSEPAYVGEGVYNDFFRIYLGDGTPGTEDFLPIKYVVTVPSGNLWSPDGGEPPVTVVLPLRQKQRDDGLALSGTPRWRARTSRQGSNRWRGYL